MTREEKLKRIWVLEKEPCTCTENPWSSCNNCMELFGLKKSIGVWPYEVPEGQDVPAIRDGNGINPFFFNTDSNDD